MLTAGTGNFYYSRRIGARPNGPVSADFVEFPNTMTILGAGKLTGRLPSGTSIGLLGAVTDDEFAKTSIDGDQSRVRVVPRSGWGQHVGLGDLFGSLSASGDNIFAVKTTLWRSP